MGIHLDPGPSATVVLVLVDTAPLELYVGASPRGGDLLVSSRHDGVISEVSAETVLVSLRVNAGNSQRETRRQRDNKRKVTNALRARAHSATPLPDSTMYWFPGFAVGGYRF